ncbi:MAG TPA: FAD-dependent oxidoreductase [Burkholderiales bacterium]
MPQRFEIAQERLQPERIEAAGVISTVSPMATFASLVERAQVPAPLRRRIERARLSHRSVSLQFGLRNRLQPKALLNMVLPMMERQREVVAQDPRAVAWPVYSVPTVALPELSASGGSIVEMFVPVAAASAEKWQAADKEELAESALRTLRRLHDMDVAVSRVRTPNDFRDQMHLHEGALYGLSPNVPPQELFPQRSPVRGLFLAGQSTYPGYGVAPTILSGIFAAEGLLAEGRIASGR